MRTTYLIDETCIRTTIRQTTVGLTQNVYRGVLQMIGKYTRWQHVCSKRRFNREDALADACREAQYCVDRGQLPLATEKGGVQ